MKKFLIITVLVLTVYSGSNACFIMCYKFQGGILVGNHEDWFADDAGLLINPPNNERYGSIVFTFLSEGWAQGGMNDQGLFFDGAYTPYQELENPRSLPNFPGHIWQQVLDKCKNVNEAIKLLGKYQLPDLEESHIVLADATGYAVILGVENGKIVFKPIEQDYLIQTNFNPWQPELSDEPVCNRYNTAESLMHESHDEGFENVKRVLEETHQDSLTVYSNIYDLKNGRITTYYKRNFNNPIEFHIEELFARGNCMFSLKDLDNLELDKCIDKPLNTFIGIVRDENGSPLPYVNIGIPEKNVGTLSNSDGTFRIDYPSHWKEEHIQFSRVGYQSKFIKPGELSSEVVLHSEAIILDEVTVRRKSQYKKLRVGWMGGKDGIVPFDTIQGGGAVALLVNAPTKEVFLDQIQVRLLYNSKDTLKFRFHIFEYNEESDKPGKEILKHEIYLTEQKKYGWLRFDLREYAVFIDSDKFFIGFEWLENEEDRRRMYRGLRAWEYWKIEQYSIGNSKVEFIPSDDTQSGKKGSYKYNGNMMNWPGFHALPPWTGLMIETGKSEKTKNYRTFRRNTSFGEWKEIDATLNAVAIISYPSK